MKEFINLNMNHYVKVKLNERGVKILEDSVIELNELLSEYGSKLQPSKPQQPDSEGFYKFQLWRFMNTFGKHMLLGHEVCDTRFQMEYYKNED